MSNNTVDWLDKTITKHQEDEKQRLFQRLVINWSNYWWDILQETRSYVERINKERQLDHPVIVVTTKVGFYVECPSDPYIKVSVVNGGYTLDVKTLRMASLKKEIETNTTFTVVDGTHLVLRLGNKDYFVGRQVAEFIVRPIVDTLLTT